MTIGNGAGSMTKAELVEEVSRVSDLTKKHSEIIVETVFSYPGVGYELIQGVGRRDFPVIQTLVVILAFFTIVLNLLTDLAVMLVTPRLRTRM